MISTPDRHRGVELIDEAVKAGASTHRACEELQISLRTYQRWTSTQGEIKSDGRPQAERPEPTNKLSAQEKQEILKTCNSEEYSSLAPSQIVPALADKGSYIASESSFYRVLRQADQLYRRGKAQAPRTVSKPTGHQASAPNQVWSWDITYLATTITGMFYRLYLVMDIYSRKIVARAKGRLLRDGDTVGAEARPVGIPFGRCASAVWYAPRPIPAERPSCLRQPRTGGFFPRLLRSDLIL